MPSRFSRALPAAGVLAVLLTATPAATVLLYWQGRTLLERGVLGVGGFAPGAICQRAWATGKAIGLVSLKL